MGRWVGCFKGDYQKLEVNLTIAQVLVFPVSCLTQGEKKSQGSENSHSEDNTHRTQGEEVCEAGKRGSAGGRVTERRGLEDPGRIELANFRMRTPDSPFHPPFRQNILGIPCSLPSPLSLSLALPLVGRL